MLLKNMLEEKKLKLNQPILSVRRQHSPMKVNGTKIENAPLTISSRIPPHRSEPKSLPVKIAGAVPFQWETTPGQPKEHIEAQIQNSENQHNSDQVTQSSTSDNKIEAVNTPHGSKNGPSADENIKRFERSKETTQESKSSNSGDCEKSFVDAFDTLSRIESFLENNPIISCLTRKDDLYPDPETWEIMLDRLKAPIKQSPIPQRRRLKMKILYQKKPGLRCGSSFGNAYSHCHNNKEKRENDKHSDKHGISLAYRGFCLKSSVCLVNPVPSKNEHEVKVKPFDNIKTAEHKENKKSWKENKEVILGIIPKETKHARSCGSGFKTFRDLLLDQASPKELDSGGFVLHKTVFVDTGTPGSREEDNETKHKRIGQMNVKDSSLKGFNKLNTNTTADIESEMLPNSYKSGDFNIPSSSIDKSNGKWGMEMPNAVGEGQYSNQDSTTTENIEEASKEKEAIKNVVKQLPRSMTLGKSGKKHFEFLVPPPLPKSPSDSWLRRTLPSVCTRNASLHPSYHDAKTKSSKPS